MFNFALFLFLFSVSALAREAAPAFVTAPEIVAEGKRLRGDHRSARVFTESELAREGGRTIGEVLREEAGVDYLSGTGGNSNLLIRGSSGSQTLVLIDGVKANDPSASNRYFDWSRIDASAIERVEILKGPQAVSYGSDAIGGVVLITTKHADAGPGGVAATASVEGGSEEFVRARGSLAKGLGQAFGGEHELSVQALGKGVFAGGSAAASRTGEPVEGDHSQEASAGIALKSRWGRVTHSTFLADIRAAQEDIDAGAYDDDPNSVARNREIRSSATIEGRFDGGTEWGFVASYLDFRRAYSDFPDAAHPTSSNDTILTGTNARGEFHLRSEADSAIEWTTGIEATRETLHIDSLLFPTVLKRDDDETYALFAETSVPLDTARRFAIDFGGRYSHFTSYGNQWNEKGGLNYKPTERVELDAGISTGFKAPSLYSLYDPTYGNPNLQPEESVQAEAGVILRPTTAVLLSLRGFDSRIRNRFGYDPSTLKSLNIARAKIRGVEFESENRVSSSLRISPSLTYLSTEDESTGNSLPDVPDWKGALKFALDITNAHSVTLSLVAKSSRGTSVGNTRVAGFYRADLTTRHRLGRAWTLTARFENLLDKDYEEVRGYRTPGLEGFVGLEFVSL
jgi:vitamin B12 transporter